MPDTVWMRNPATGVRWKVNADEAGLARMRGLVDADDESGAPYGPNANVDPTADAWADREMRDGGSPSFDPAYAEGVLAYDQPTVDEMALEDAAHDDDAMDTDTAVRVRLGTESREAAVEDRDPLRDGTVTTPAALHPGKPAHGPVGGPEAEANRQEGRDSFAGLDNDVESEAEPVRPEATTQIDDMPTATDVAPDPSVDRAPHSATEPTLTEDAGKADSAGDADPERAPASDEKVDNDGPSQPDADPGDPSAADKRPRRSR